MQYHVMDVFQSESTLYGYLNIDKLLAQNRHDTYSQIPIKSSAAI